MNAIKQNAKQILPKPVWQTASALRTRLRHATLWPAATFHPWRQASRRQLAALKNKHQGQRGFIIGNGPSLKDTDLSKLESELSIGMNRFYLMYPELGFTTTYFLTVNSLVIEQCADDIRGLPIPKFLSWRSRHLIQPTEDTIFLHTTYAGPKFSPDARARLWEGATVTYVALQLAFHLGWDPVILIGVDHSFVSQGDPNTTVVSDGDDPNHFHPAYFGKGFRWQLPDLETSEQAYRLARQAYEHAGRRVLDATVGGKLTVFPKETYNSLF